MSIFNLYSASLDINLSTAVPSTEVTYHLYYVDKHITNLTTDNPIEIEPITEDGKTESFYVKATSNLNSNKTVFIRVVPKTFYKIDSNDDLDIKSYSGVEPRAIFKKMNRFYIQE
jgi:hypothetical protein